MNGNTRASAAFGQRIGRLDRMRVGRSVAMLLWGLVFCTVIAFNSPAAAQLSGIGTDVAVPANSNPVIGGTNTVIGTTTLSGTTLDGQGGQGYYVGSGGLLTINNSTLKNFTTTGGSGSGGGLGAGGAIFIDIGGKVFLNNTSFFSNTAIGGTGGTSSPYGGTLNNYQTLNPLGTAPNGLNGINGAIVPDDQYTFGDGNGNGIPGCCHTDAKNAFRGFGGIGGFGGPGTNGWSTNPVLEEGVTIATLGVVTSAFGLAIDVAQLVNDSVMLGLHIADSSNPFDIGSELINTVDKSVAVVLGTLGIANDAIGLTAAVKSLVLAQAQLTSWQNMTSLGYNGNGGNGEDGGNGGKGSYGFGGGGGGQGGAYGLSAVANAYDGIGGAGGNGGAGGFGAGGGAGGYAFGEGQNGNGVAVGTSQNGTPGSGGAPGFGGGVGSTGGITGGIASCLGNTPGIACGGGGGYGFGGAIFVNSGASLTIQGNAAFDGNSAIGGASLNNGPGGGSTGSDLFIMPGGIVNLAPGAGNVITFNGSIADWSTASNEIPTGFPPLAPAVGAGGSVNIYAGLTVFNGWNTYSSQTVINGGAFGGPLNPGTNTTGTPNYALTDGALQVGDQGLPIFSNLNFSGPGQYTGGVLQLGGSFTRFVSANPNPNGGSNPGGFVQWTGSGGFAAIDGPLTVTLNSGSQLTWGANGFVPSGYSLIFGSVNSNDMVTFTNPIDISGGTIAAGTAASILVGYNGNPSGSAATMSGVISGSGDLSIGGGGFNGTLILSGANTYTGTTFVNSGALALAGSGSIASSSSLTIGSAAGFDLSQTSAGASIATLTGTGNVALGAQKLTVTNGGAFSGAFTDGGIGGGTGGGLTVAGGTLTLSGNSTYTGTTTVNPGATLALFGAGSIANTSNVMDNGTFDISQTSFGAMIGSLSGSGAAPIGSKLLVITSGSTTFSGHIDDGGLGGGTGGGLIVAGGTQTLSGVNTYTGATIVNTGATLALSGAGSIATSPVVDVLGAFDISQTSAGASIKTLMGTGNVALGSQKLTITAGSTDFGGTIADGGIGGGTGGKLQIGGGIQTLSGTNTYTGTTTIDLGTTLALTGNGSIANSGNVMANGTFDISQTLLGAAIKTLSGSGNVALGARLLGITAGSTTFSGVIADGGIAGGTGGALAINGGTQTLSGVSAYTGGTLIASGATLALSGGGAIATSAAVIDNGFFDISQIASATSINTLIGTGNVALGAKTLTITAASTEFSGVLADGGIGGGTGGGLVVNGGVQTLSGVSTYTGDTTIAPNPVLGTATLALTGNGSIATSSAVQIATGGTLDISQTSVGASIKTLADSGATPSGNVALGSKTLTITNGSTAFSGVIADGGIGGGAGGNLTVTGGTQTLAGVNTYTGATSIAPSSGSATLALALGGSIATSSQVSVATNGTFDISATTAGAAITTLSGSGSVTLGGKTLTVTAGAAGPSGTNPAGIFSGAIGGLGGLAIAGGHQELTGPNTYSGGTTVTNGATVSVNSSSSLGASTSPLTLNNGTLLANGSIAIPQPVNLLGAPPGTDVIDLNANNVTLSGALNGPGVLTAINGGKLILTGTVGTTTAIGGIVLGPGSALNASASANVGLANAPIVLVSPTNTSTLLFTGSLHVVGPLDVTNGTIPQLNILPGDTLVGVGSVNIATVIQGGGGIVAGDGPGTIFVNGPLTNLSGSTYTVQIDGPIPSATNCVNPLGCAGQYGSIVVLGAGNTYTAGGAIAPLLRGIDPPANNNYTPPVTTQFTVVQAVAGVLGSFASITQPVAALAPGTRFDALYVNGQASLGANAIDYSQNAAGNPTAIDLWVTPENYQNLSIFNVSLSQNQSQVGFALNALRGEAGLKNNAMATWDFGKLFAAQPQSLPAIFDTLSGEINTGARQGAFQLNNQLLGLMLDPTLIGRSGGADIAATGYASEPLDLLPSDVALGYASVLKAPKAALFDQRWSAWASAYGGTNKTNGDPTAAGTHELTARAYGFAAGMDYHLTPDTVVGFALAGGGTNWNLTQGLGAGRSDAFQAGQYATSHFGSAYLAEALVVANHWMTTERTAFGADRLNASFMAQSLGARIEAGNRFEMPWIAVTPYAAVQTQVFHTPNYGENDLSGGGFGLAYNTATTTDLRGEVGARFDSVMGPVDGMQLILRTRGAWLHDWVRNPALTATFQAALQAGAVPGAGVSFSVNGASSAADSALVTAGLELRVKRSLSLSANYEGQLANVSQTHSVKASVRASW